MDGIGVLIQRMGGNAETVAAYRASVGQEIVSVTIEDDILAIKFAEGSVLEARDQGQSCCEHRHMSSDDDLASFVGHRLVSMALEDGPEVEADYDCHEQQFLKVQTDKGSFTVVNHNEHNGYYGGFSIALTFKAGA